MTKRNDKSQKILFYATLFIYLFLTFRIAYSLLTTSIYSDILRVLFILMSFTLIPLLFLISRKNFNLFEPVYLYVYFFALGYIFTTYYIINDVNLDVFHSLNYEITDSSTVIVMYILTIGISCFYIGYLLSDMLHKNKKFTFLNLNKVDPYTKHFKVIAFLYSITLLFRVYGYATGFLGSTAASSDVQLPNIPMISVFYFLSNNWYLFFAYFALLSFLSKKYLKIFLIVSLFEFSFTLLSGNRRDIVVMAMVYLAAYWYVNRVFPWKKIIIPAIIILFVFLPISTVYGYYLANNLHTNLSVGDTISYLSNGFAYFISSTDKKSILDFVIFPIVQSYNLLSNTCIAYTQFYMHHIEFGPIGIHSFLGSLLPSFLNPDKQAYARHFFNLYGQVALNYKVDYSNLTITFPTEMIMSYGISGVYIGMFVMGYFMNLFYKYLNAKNTPLFFRIFYIGNIAFFSYGLNGNWLGGDMMLTYRLLIYCVLFYALYKILLFKYRKVNIIPK